MHRPGRQTSPNRRFVLTGGPGGGKTTLIEALSARGYACVPESARAIIRARLAAGLSPRPAPGDFAMQILAADVEKYRAAAPDALTFFDRSIVDALGMVAESAAMPPAEIEENLRRYPYNRMVFLLPPWPAIYRTDGERDQTFTDAVRISALVRAWYEQCGYELREVPFGAVFERVEYILRAVAEAAKAG